MSTHVVSWVLDHSPAQLVNRLVLLVLADKANRDGTGAWPHPRTIAREARCSLRSAYYALDALEAAGAITQTDVHDSGCKVWRVNMTLEAESANFAQRPTGRRAQDLRAATADIALQSANPARASINRPEPSDEPPPNPPQAGGSTGANRLGPELPPRASGHRQRDVQQAAAARAEAVAAYVAEHPVACVADAWEPIAQQLRDRAGASPWIAALHPHEVTAAGLVLGTGPELGSPEASAVFAADRYGPLIEQLAGAPVRVIPCGCPTPQPEGDA